MAKTGRSVVTYNPSASNANWRDTTNSADRTFGGGASGDKTVNLLGSGGVAGAQNYIHYTANARM
ncbi:hypothetical protein [Acidicapsa acidisoli]|uniref:hypothetical protein n=1 Tax=Acidicapsa acidisoli TaxID=1615681 RepID=UPI0021E077CB|nr:hypothetical protein [Acidicapsa acidisoli]